MDLLRGLVDQLAPDRREVLGIVVAVALSLVATVLALRLAAPTTLVRDDRADQPVSTEAPGPAPSPSSSPTTGLVVHVAGAVASPGVVVLPAGARVADAVAAAGGALPAAALDGLNLARALVDGEQVRVPDAEGIGPAPPAPVGGVQPDGRIELNRATAVELQELPGIGEVTAERIVAWRDEHGPFSEAVQLREVRGIGEATWTDVRDLVVVTP